MDHFLLNNGGPIHSVATFSFAWLSRRSPHMPRVQISQVEDFARSLGAKVQTNLSKNATHLVLPDGYTADMLKVKALFSPYKCSKCQP